MIYNTVKIYEDGNCFFRCLSVYIKDNLQTCKRMKNGRCQSRNLFTKETELSNSLRDLVIHHISLNKKNYLDENTDGCLTYLEDETFEEHIERMSEDGEFAENLEIKAASDFLKINISIWVNNKGVLNKIDEKNGYDNTLNLLLSDDEHYDYLIINSNIEKSYKEDIKVNETNSINKDNTCKEDINEDSNSLDMDIGKINFVYPVDEREIYCIPYKMKTIDYKNGFLVKHTKEHYKKLCLLDNYNCIRIDENHIFFNCDNLYIEEVRKILEN